MSEDVNPENYRLVVEPLDQLPVLFKHSGAVARLLERQVFGRDFPKGSLPSTPLGSRSPPSVSLTDILPCPLRLPQASFEKSRPDGRANGGGYVGNWPL